MKCCITIIFVFVLSTQQSIGQNQDSYKFGYFISLSSTKTTTDPINLNLDSIPLSLVRFNFQILSKKKLSKTEIKNIKECLRNNPNPAVSCEKKDEYVIYRLL